MTADEPRPVKLPWEQDIVGETTANLAIGGLRETIMRGLTDERGVHAETLMVVIGALAGFAAQQAAWDRVKRGDVPLTPAAAEAIRARPDDTVDIMLDDLQEQGLFLAVSNPAGSSTATWFPSRT